MKPTHNAFVINPIQVINAAWKRVQKLKTLEKKDLQN